MKIEDLRIRQEVWVGGEKRTIDSLMLPDTVLLRDTNGKLVCPIMLSIVDISLSPPKKKVKRELDCWVTVNNHGEAYQKYSVWFGGFVSEDLSYRAKLIFEEETEV